jgi:hypothetical protein
MKIQSGIVVILDFTLNKKKKNDWDGLGTKIRNFIVDCH